MVSLGKPPFLPRIALNVDFYIHTTNGVNSLTLNDSDECFHHPHRSPLFIWNPLLQRTHNQRFEATLIITNGK